ncbi:MAG: Gfo/Idh/MocA family oxidoreductase [Verrucomicrobia bacterium]|nr:Gfo/Idh/MocA family oxidoreductase [Verrucomicrobiota bacterium]MDA1068082.1 Gfo/Idh/MocA family oxidoreductase [Verrucomicrobiota bacterium]
MMNTPINRRNFVKTTAAAGAGLLIMPSGSLFGQSAASNKLNIALIGAYGRATAHYNVLKTQNVVAICDVHDDYMAIGAKEFPKATRYKDWRKALDQKDVDAVVICTPDHLHGHISSWALNRDYHVYCEKPLGNSVHEARYNRLKWLEKKDKLATQVGTQRHAIDNFARVRELIRDGVIGELKDVHAWGNRELREPGYPKKEGKPPAGLDWDLWLGPSPWHDYNPRYYQNLPEKPGSNCLNWNMFWDFGSGQIGDMGAHTMDLVWNALDADLPTSAEAKGEAFNPEVVPVDMHSWFMIPANDWRGEVRVNWWQGAMKPKMPNKFIDVTKIGHGGMFVGSEGALVCDFTTRAVLPYGKNANMTYYQPRPKKKLVPPSIGFQEEWINAAKTDMKTSCDFDYNGKMMEMMFLGLVAYKAGKKVQYDGKKGKIVGNPEAGKMLKKHYREGWPLNG